MSDAPKPEVVYDQRLANQAAAIDQCLKLGGVVIEPGKPTTGFAPPPPRRP